MQHAPMLESRSEEVMSKTHAYPEPFVVPPRQEHTHSFILLHGRGSNGEKFGVELLKTRTGTSNSEPADMPVKGGILQHACPGTKFIFPTAKKRRARWYKRASINQWFDGVPIDAQEDGVTKDQEEWQLEGLRESRAFLKTIVDLEVNAVGAGNVFVGGMSQGCAMALHFLMSYEGADENGRACSDVPHLGCFVGMSGWLPFQDDIMSELAPIDPGEDDEDLFATSDDEHDGQIDNMGLFEHDADGSSERSPATRVCNLVRDNMDLPPIASSSPLCLSTPVFLGHGRSDEKVNMERGVQAADALRQMGMQVTWKDYDEGHWYKVPQEIEDIVRFLDDL
ncbi:uncharacterized protein LTR77_005986 [Saxophila tyrrhenica]|uniref:Acyl-protein thioesterase 1 n=1 Tax=Saxophila tyrrhenica TaxID=1690608 RepID=A0AAV9PAL3_9PEZI|nr:hypothetical protein LTR77_005986 [Saxophila tyrrhenica]